MCDLVMKYLVVRWALVHLLVVLIRLLSHTVIVGWAKN